MSSNQPTNEITKDKLLASLINRPTNKSTFKPGNRIYSLSMLKETPTYTSRDKSIMKDKMVLDLLLRHPQNSSRMQGRQSIGQLR